MPLFAVRDTAPPVPPSVVVNAALIAIVSTESSSGGAVLCGSGLRCIQFCRNISPCHLRSCSGRSVWCFESGRKQRQGCKNPRWRRTTSLQDGQSTSLRLANSSIDAIIVQQYILCLTKNCEKKSLVTTTITTISTRRRCLGRE